MATKKNGQNPLIADMYARWTLDLICEAVHAIASDFVNRPRQYTSLPGDTAPGNTPVILEDFWYRSGTDPTFPDFAKRQLIFTPLLGPSDGRAGEHGSQFHDNSSALRERARAFTERQVETGEENLRRAFLDEVATFKSYLSTLVGNTVVENGDRQTRGIFEAAVSVLFDNAVSGVFGRPPATTQGWPLDSKSLEDNGARLIEEVSNTLQLTDGIVTQSQFIVMQRIALYGAGTLSGVLSADIAPKNLSENDPLIQVAYSWKTALDALT